MNQKLLAELISYSELVRSTDAAPSEAYGLAQKMITALMNEVTV